MKITKKDLQEWVMNGTPVRYHGVIYKCHYNGIRYFLWSAIERETIDIYKKGHGVYGLVTNKI